MNSRGAGKQTHKWATCPKGGPNAFVNAKGGSKLRRKEKVAYNAKLGKGDSPVDQKPK